MDQSFVGGAPPAFGEIKRMPRICHRVSFDWNSFSRDGVCCYLGIATIKDDSTIVLWLFSTFPCAMVESLFCVEIS